MIHKQMVAILRDVDFIGKTERNQAQGFSFRGIDQVFNELHGTFAKHGVYVRPIVLEHNHIERPTKSGGVALHHFVRVQFNFTAEDGSSTEMLGIGEAADNGDKGVSKCLSISMKYALLQAFLIPTVEEKDPDASATEWKGRKGKGEPDPPGVQRNTPEQQAALAQQRVAQVQQQAKVTLPVKSAATSNDYQTLAKFQVYKKDIGETWYRRILQAAGVEKSNQLTDSKAVAAVLAAMEQAKKMLTAFGQMGEALGREAFIRVLGANGYENVSEIPDIETAKRIYHELSEAKKQADMRRDDPEAATALFDIGAPSASLKDPR